MNRYTVFFELFGKKMRTEVDAASEADAKSKIAEKIIFHKVEKLPRRSPFEKFVDPIRESDYFKDIECFLRDWEFKKKNKK